MLPGCFKAEHSQVREVTIGPAFMIQTTSFASTFTPFAFDTAQAHSNPSIDRFKGGLVTVLVVLEPALEDRIHFADDTAHAGPISPLRSGSDLRTQLLEALLTRPSITAFEVVTKKIETSF